nr:ABC transporter substrate-binding protein [Candidatus Wallbacteria bacterium]
FAGYYMAYEIGIYKKYGIDLEILDGGPSAPAVKALEEKKADFVTLQLSAAIERRAKGVKLINIAQISQRSAILIVAKKKSGIKEVKDLNGKHIGFWRTDFDGILRTFLHKHNLKVQTVPINYTVNLFLLDGIDAMVTMWYNEYYKIINSGLDEDELVKFLFFEHDLNLPEDGIYCLEETYNRDPALCRDFVKASIEGWIYAFAHEEQAVEAVLKYMNRAHVTANKPHQRWMLARMCDIISPQNSKSSIGDLLEPDYLRVASILSEFKVIDSIPDFKTFFINQAAKDVKK